MKINCIHGYLKFEETRPGQIQAFSRLFGLEIERSGDHFTLSDLVDAPDYSIQGGIFINAPTLFTYAGPPWEVMRENRLVYQLGTGLIVPMDMIVQIASIKQSGDYLVSTGMIQAGSLTDAGKRITDYAAHYIPELSQFRYSEISYG